MEKSDSIYRLKGYVQHYSWGGYDFIPSLLKLENQKREPFAELWMGTHANGPSHLLLPDGRIPLSDFIAQAPEYCLGAQTARRFHRQLPFLFKVLDVQHMLSIQAHPNKRQAEAGFRRENELSIPLNSPNRVFKDDNHKPEVMVAITDFWLLHGFRPIPEMSTTIAEIPEWESLNDVLREGGIAALYRYIMELPQPEVNRLLDPLRQRVLTAFDAGQLTKDQPAYWAAKAFREHTTTAGDHDRGIFSIFLFHLIHLLPNEGIFQDAGIPHAYLEGVNIELMANSDNVFRGGLTTKHIDIGALMDHLIFEPIVPKILTGAAVSPTERCYPTPAPDFELSRIRIVPGQTHFRAATSTPNLFIALEGTGNYSTNEPIQKGDIFFVPADREFSIQATETLTIYSAAIPVTPQQKFDH